MGTPFPGLEPKNVTLQVDEKADATRAWRSIRFKSMKPKKGKLTKIGSSIERLPIRFQELLTEKQAQSLARLAKCLFRPGLGILAVDDTIRQVNAKLEEIHLYPSNLNRYFPNPPHQHKLHKLYLGGGLPLDDFLSGILLREESISHDVLRDKKLVYKIKDHHLKLGIRMDRGVVPLAGTDREFTTLGLDTLEKDCQRVKDLGAEFTLWRCVYTISDTNPSRLAIEENSRTLARFAAVCQKAGLLPIVSVDVLPQGDHDEIQASASLKQILSGLVKALADSRVYLEGSLLRVTAAAPGICYNKGAHDLVRVAAGTVEALKQCVPPALGGAMLARTENLARSLKILNEMQNCPIKKPFFMSFCFSRVILDDVISIWAGQDKNLGKARNELVKRLEGDITKGRATSALSDLNLFSVELERERRLDDVPTTPLQTEDKTLGMDRLNQSRKTYSKRRRWRWLLCAR